MEKLLHYTWKHRLLPLGTLRTTDGQEVEVIDPGLYNRADSGPDFFNAKVKIDGTLWVGSVEMHLKASDWYRHRHDEDEQYDNVVLHVVEVADMDIQDRKGHTIPTIEVPIPRTLSDDYEQLLNSDKYPPCYHIIPSLAPLKTHSWMSALETERLEQKTKAMISRVEQKNGSWEDGYFVTLARNFGFSLNGDNFERWAMALPMGAAAHHRDDLFQLEALFIGQAGLLDRVDERYAKEYDYLSKKFRLDNTVHPVWRYLRTRPQNFPHVRIMQLARMYHEQRTSLSRLLDCENIKQLTDLFGLSKNINELIIINTAVPTLFAYGRHHSREELCERAYTLLDALHPEGNHIVRMWQECGLEVKTAGDSQALIQLKKEYCDRKECLRCRFGFEYLSKKH